jgi:hypothetical protein
MMAAASLRFVLKGWVRDLYLVPQFHFSYPWFEWVHPWPAPLMYGQFILTGVFACCMAVGFCYRLSAVLFFFSFGYIELLDQTAYLNHYYLITLLGGLLVFLPAHRLWSVDAWLKPSLRSDASPSWCMNLLRFQIAVVYVFAGLAKFNADWLLRAEPLRVWLAARGDMPIIGHWLAEPWVAFAGSWCGAIFDTSIVFFLLSRRFRGAAFAALVLFHVATWMLFNIGMFPWIMIVSATVFFPADWPRRWLRRINATAGTISESSLPAPPRLLVKWLLALYAIVQLALPLRPYLQREPAAWSCSGFNCAWQVMIAEKTGSVEFFSRDPVSGDRVVIPVRNYITPRQEMMMAQDPYLIREMARFLARQDDGSGTAWGSVYADAFATMNGWPGRRLINQNVNLADARIENWILPFAQNEREGGAKDVADAR